MPSAPLSRTASASISFPLYVIQMSICIEGCLIFQIISGGTLGILDDQRLPILLVVQQGIDTTLLGNAPGEFQEKTDFCLN